MYGRADGELLETFAEQLALVIENTNLIQSMVEKERLKSEVMLAREIQQALLDAARARREANSIRGGTKQQLQDPMEGAGGVVYGGVCGRAWWDEGVKGHRQ